MMARVMRSGRKLWQRQFTTRREVSSREAAPLNILKCAGRKHEEKAKEGVDGGKRERSEQDRQAVEVFNQLTEAASTLMDAGELNIYSTSREVSISTAPLPNLQP